MLLRPVSSFKASSMPHAQPSLSAMMLAAPRSAGLSTRTILLCLLASLDTVCFCILPCTQLFLQLSTWFRIGPCTLWLCGGKALSISIPSLLGLCWDIRCCWIHFCTSPYRACCSSRHVHTCFFVSNPLCSATAAWQQLLSYMNLHAVLGSSLRFCKSSKRLGPLRLPAERWLGAALRICCRSGVSVVH